MTELHSFATPEEALAHYGVKGMKWGVHRDGVSDHEISDARHRVVIQNRQVKGDIKAVKGDKSLSRGEKKASISEIKLSALANPDRLTAARMTHGEKAILSLIAVGVPFGIPAVAGAVAINASAKKTVRKKIIEKQTRDALNN